MKYLFIIALIILTGCYYDNEQDLYPPGSENCDTTVFTYSGAVLPIINDNCIRCHGDAATGGNILLVDYNTISAQAIIPAGQTGSLYGAIIHNPSNFGMPKNDTQLSNCKILKIKKWIDAGALDN
jgi:hypothetical protein